MSDEEIQHLTLPYGQNGRFEIDLLERQLMLWHHAPPQLPGGVAAIAQAFETPVDFPDFSRAVLGDDRVVVVIDVDTPQADDIFRELWQRLSETGLPPENVTLVQPAVWKKVEGVDPRRKLPVELIEKFTLLRHDPTQAGACAYLASTASGERVYLSRLLTEADVVITVGPAEFDPVLGVRATASSLYPGLSDVDALRRAQGQGHEELGPGDARPFRQMVDEVGWLLGLQLSVAVIPSSGAAAHRVLAGQTHAVLEQAKQSLERNWLVNADQRAELVLVTVTADASGHGWEQVAAAIEAGRRLVERNGRIVVLSQIDAVPGPGLDILKSMREPRDALRPIQKANAPDLVTASRIAAAADWANVSLLSKLDPSLVSDLFLVPLESETEARRLLQNEDLTAVIESAQHAFVQNNA
ncbi:lactate racemase domain-containing protein [Planctomicrobium piriforme]|uniref:Nickel-dependent lactate racemase n=1 Tax=Planctomicrobium piriforme TaxID=1576369 RepID=A0A1I3D7G8_9PLAN|nr:lactate racemase domain-containing protein [Planctomicrobium piriforme]SFH82637.1 Nickel-dependent lactate racemase [Planctomicrobium piriforme]